MSRSKEIVIRIGSEILKLREGESRTVNLPMVLRVLGGCLHIIPPDIVGETVQEDK